VRHQPADPRTLPTVDLDSLDEAIADALQELVDRHIGDAPTRFGQAAGGDKGSSLGGDGVHQDLGGYQRRRDGERWGDRVGAGGRPRKSEGLSGATLAKRPPDSGRFQVELAVPRR
jgi:hypothetical protein